MNALTSLLAEHLRKLADQIESGECELTQSLKTSLLGLISHEPMSKPQSYSYLGISRSKFDSLIKLNIIPEGVKRVGFKEKVWYKDELDSIKNKLNL